MGRMRRVLAVAAAVALAMGAAGCPTEPASDGSTGTVVAHKKWRYTKCSIRSCYGYKITVKTPTGRDTGKVSKVVYAACPVGARWPTCKENV